MIDRCIVCCANAYKATQTNICHFQKYQMRYRTAKKLWQRVLSPRTLTSCTSKLHKNEKAHSIKINTRGFNTNSFNLCLYPEKTSSFQAKDTICALSSAPGQAGVSVIRVSGTQSWEVLSRFTNIKENVRPRHAQLAKIYDPNTRDLIDTGLVLWFPGPFSYTGEDSVEFHTHGSVAVVHRLLDCLVKHNEVRLAHAGEFSRRAFYNNKMDLTQIEGIGDLIKAETEEQRKQAVDQVNGSMTKLIKKWQEKLIDCITELEAFIEFHDSDYIELDLRKISLIIQLLRGELDLALNNSRRAISLSKGVGVAIYGMPNAGKSSLFNVLVKSDRALVSNMPGTTRDTIEVPLDIAGFRVNLKDTAGLRLRTDCAIEEMGIQRAIGAMFAENTGAHILVFPADIYRDISNSETDLIKQVVKYVSTFAVPDILNENAKSFEELFKKPTLLVINKDDLISPDDRSKFDAIQNTSHFVSCTKNSGINQLFSALEKLIQNSFSDYNSGDPYCTTIRQKQAIRSSLKMLDHFLQEVEHKNVDYGIIVQYLKMGLRELNYLTGYYSNEEVLTRIFENFCIGK